MPRMSIYVTDELKARMDEIGDHISWSPLAQRAFEEAIARQRVVDGDGDMTDVVERLKASKAKYEEDNEATGIEVGQAWAKESAEYDELLRLSNLYETWKESQIDWDHFTNAGNIYGAIRKPDDFDWEDAKEWWVNRLSGSGLSLAHNAGLPSSRFLFGFVKGAAGVFDEVKDQL